MHKAKSTDGKREKEPALEPPIADASGPEVASPSMESRTVLPAQDMKTNPQPPYGNSAPRNEGLDAPPEDRVFIDVGGGGPLLPGEGHGELSGLQQPLRIPMPLPGDVSSSSSSSSSRVTQPPARVVGLSENGSNRRLQQTSPSRNDSKEGSALERLTLALERGGINSRMDDLQIKMLADYQPFDPAQHDIKSWTAGFSRLVPDEASNEQALKALECRLPHQYADLLMQTRSENGVFTICWKESVRLFLDRVAGSENRLVGLRRLRTLTQIEGESIRQFAIRVRDLLQRIRGKEPTDEEWKDEVIVGAHNATAVELDRVANQTPGIRDFWEVIRLAEFWERQHAVLLNQGDPSSALDRSPSKGASVLLEEPTIPREEPTVVCTWCSQRGHLEDACLREPRCARCFGFHPERNHDAVVRARRADFAASILNLSVDAEFSALGGRDFSVARDSKDFDLLRPPPPPPRALERAAQDAVERERKKNTRRGKQQTKGYQ